MLRIGIWETQILKTKLQIGPENIGANNRRGYIFL